MPKLSAGATEGRGRPAGDEAKPFINFVYRLLGSPKDAQSLISWCPNGTSFTITDPERCAPAV